MASRSDHARFGFLVVWTFIQTASAAPGTPVKLTTWNLDWLTLLPASSPLLPEDAPHRNTRDWQALQTYADRLNADILAVQEVSDETALRQLFPSPVYSIALTHAPIAQNLGVVLRKPWHINSVISLQAFDRSSFHGGHALRPAMDATVSDGSTILRLLAVHLKSGCWDRSWTERDHACPILREQITLVANWMAEREDEGEPYIVLGDFNRRLTLTDPYYRQMSETLSPVLATAGHASPCEGGTYFIDHIVIGGPIRSWLIPDSLRVMTYADNGGYLLSDHCPVSVKILVPARAKR
ncbi:endonuclease/exonuclease/phosphatase family protein [Asaia bogorensis]|uniref:endonuclease/exonuclease/phosphatase family protein n=1 Tax=Asaia bogorensis TaxID=91915 RepID=UPI001F120915|nr:endonuclease/exonuclease/phosphatase family protein [Asaia bogorensis]